MAADQLFPITMKPGILRDGTKFQGEYCTDGQWVRFYRGMPKKIGGMKALQGTAAPLNSTCFTTVSLDNNIIYLLVNDINIWYASSGIDNPYQLTTNFTKALAADFAYPNYLWQTINYYVETENATHVLFFGSPIKNNINAVGAPVIYIAKFTNNDQIPEIISNPIKEVLNKGNQNILKYLNGGCAYSQVLFLYGNNGLIAYSTRENPLIFNLNVIPPSVSSGGINNISNDKVIFAAPIRGGTNTPSMLFWTTNNLIKASNNSEDSDTTVVFSYDNISSSITVLSTKSIIEYDGIYFWLGTDRIFIYNGVVREVQNNLNFNWFFKNINMAKKQLIFAVKDALKGEIWWFFPFTGSDICNWALVYNIRDNFWYDTPITRECGLLDNISNKMMTYGPKLVNPDGNNYIWVHEEGVQQQNNNGLFEDIPSSFTTPTFSFASFNMNKQEVCIDRWTFLKRIEPDFNLAIDSTISMKINRQQYAKSPIVVYPDAVIYPNGIPFNGLTPKVDLNTQGRLLSLTFSSTDDFEMGHVLLLMNIGDGQ